MALPNSVEILLDSESFRVVVAIILVGVFYLTTVAIG